MAKTQPRPQDPTQEPNKCHALLNVDVVGRVDFHAEDDVEVAQLQMEIVAWSQPRKQVAIQVRPVVETHVTTRFARHSSDHTNFRSSRLRHGPSMSVGRRCISSTDNTQER